MKTLAILLTVFCSSFFAGNVSLAEEPQEPQGEFQSFERPEGGMEREGSMEGKRKMMGAGMMKMHGKGGMMGEWTKVVATSDGGVVVLQGPKLAKYDAQLNLVNEVELKGGPKPAGHGHGDKEAPKEGPVPVSEEEVSAMLDQASAPAPA